MGARWGREHSVPPRAAGTHFRKGCAAPLRRRTQRARASTGRPTAEEYPQCDEFWLWGTVPATVRARAPSTAMEESHTLGCPTALAVSRFGILLRRACSGRCWPCH